MTALCPRFCRVLIGSDLMESSNHMFFQGPKLRWFASQRNSTMLGPDLRSCLAIVRENKKKRDSRDLSGTSNADSNTPEVIESDPSQEKDLKDPEICKHTVDMEKHERAGVSSTSLQAIKSPSFQYTHFISIPLALHPALLDSVKDFQDSVLESFSSSSDDSGVNDKGIDESIFVKPTTFHLTLLMLKLWNEKRVHAAIDCLQETMPQVHEALNGAPLSIKLRGVDCMRGNPAKAHVLYAVVEPDGHAQNLLRASQVITEVFTQAGLVMDKDQKQTLKLHATLMNTTQRKVSGRSESFRSKKRIPFDATEIVTKYGSHAWGEYRIPEAHLSQRFVYDENGYYHCCGSITFP